MRRLTAAAALLLITGPAPAPAGFSVAPARLAIVTGQCNGGDLQVKVRNPHRKPIYARVVLKGGEGLHLPRRLIETWLPPGYSRTVPVTVSAVTAGDYTVRVTSGADRLSIPVTVTAPVPSQDLVRTASRVTASSARAGLLACGAVDGDADPARWRKGTGWADATGREWPDWLAVAWDEPQRIAAVDLVTVDSAEFPVGGFGLRDWDVQVRAGDGWETVTRVRGNTRATVRSTFAPRRTTEMRIMTYAANGTNDWSRIVEIRVHPEVPDELPAADSPR